MRKDELQILWAYNEWANRRILATAAQLPPALFTTPVSSSFGSLRGTLVHIYGAEEVWRQRCQEGKSPLGLPVEKEFPDLESLRIAWETGMNRIHAFIDHLDPSALDAQVTYVTSKDVPNTTPFWQILAHLVNHGTQFRSEAGMLLSAWGLSPGDWDLIYYLRSKS